MGYYTNQHVRRFLPRAIATGTRKALLYAGRAAAAANLFCNSNGATALAITHCSTGRGRLFSCLSAFALALAVAPNSAAAQSWDGSDSNDWSDGANWSGGAVPGGGHVDILTTAPNPTVLGVGGPAAGVTAQLYVGRFNGQDGDLTVQNGSTLTTNAYARIGEWNGSTGVVTVTGAGTSWAINGSISLIVGNRGIGTLNIDDGASVTANHPSGYTIVGNTNMGTMNISNGGTLTSGGSTHYAVIGLSSGGTGVVTIDGAGSMWTIAEPVFMVGRAGGGTLNIQNGGAVVVENGTELASLGGSTGTLDLSGGGILDTLFLTAGNGTPQVNFDDGILQARADNTNFITGFSGTELDIAAGGLEVDSAGSDIGTDTTSAFTGVGGLTKAGAGTFTLLASNSYTGGTTITSGTLQLGNGGTSGSITGNVLANGTLAFNRSDDVTFTGVISGAGAVRQIGSGLTELTADSSAFAGETFVEAGTLAVNGSLCGDMTVESGGRLEGTGTVCDTTNSGVIAPGNSIGTILVNGNYAGGGELEIEAEFGDDGFPADRLLITGNVTGTTTVNAINLGGAGAATGVGPTDGASVIQVGGTSTADAFTLPGDYVAVGPYQYVLNAFDPASSDAGELDPLLAAEGVGAFWDYRLQSEGEPVPQIAAYQALPSGAFRYSAALMDAMHDPDESCAVGNTEFIRTKGAHTDFDGDKGPDYKQKTWFTQGGVTPVGWQLGNGSVLCAGIAVNVGRLDIDIENSGAEVDALVPGAALIGTYRTVDGWYVNALAIANRFLATVTTDERGTAGKPDGTGVGVSMQGGHAIDMGESGNRAFILEPEARLSWQRIWFEKFTDVDGVRTNLQDGDSLRGRVGTRLEARPHTGEVSRWAPYAGAYVVREFLAGDSINAGDVDFPTDLDGTVIHLDAGLKGEVSPGVNVLVAASYENGIGEGTGDTLSATARVVWRY